MQNLKKIYPLSLLLMQHRNTQYQGNSYFISTSAMGDNPFDFS